MVNYNYYFQIAGLTVGIQSPVPVAFRPCMEPFQIASAEAVDLCYEIRWLEQQPDMEKIAAKPEFSIWKKDGCFIREKSIWGAGQTWSVFQKPTEVKGKSILYIPRGLLGNEELFAKFDLFRLLAVEEDLLFHDAFILHSSFVAWQGWGILFTAPSGTGKSTQADLWKQYEQADIYNGDRTIIRKKEQGYYGFGSHYAGSSGIYRNASAPIRAIVVLTQAPENRIEPLRGRQAFAPLFRETLMNTWNPAYMEHMTDLILDAVESIPVYHLACRPDADAVKLVKETVFPREEP